jgi:Protein of unknown function (DUF551)
MEWRVGRKVPINVYDERDQPVCQCQTAAYAELIVKAVNLSRHYAARECEEWVAVSERLPACGAVYLVWCYDNRDKNPHPWQDLATYSYMQGWCVGGDGNDYRENAAVTHWRPLPAPPAAQGEKL